MTLGQEDQDSGNGWPEYRMWVKRELTDHGTKLETIQEGLAELRSQVAGLKVRVAIASAVAASIISAIITLVVKRLIG